MDTINQYIEQIQQDRKRHFFRAAIERGFTIEVISAQHRLTRFTRNGRAFLLVDDFTSFNTKATAVMTRNKDLTKQILAAHGISVPRGFTAASFEEAAEKMAQHKLAYPVVAKPIDAAKGVAISLGITSPDALRVAVRRIDAARSDTALMVSREFVVEEEVRGNDFRVLVLDGKVLACAQRIPARVVGDGRSTIAALIAQHNEKRPKGYRLKVDDALQQKLRTLGLTPESVPAQGATVTLRDNANISSGGIAVDYTSRISQRFVRICERVSAILQAQFIGIDLFVDDVTKEDAAQPYAILEVNGAPDYDIHEEAVVQGGGVDVTGALLTYLYERRSYRITAGGQNAASAVE